MNFWWVTFQKGVDYTKPMAFDEGFFKGGSTQNRWLLMRDFQRGSTQNRWVSMGDFSKGGVHKTDEF